jgi:hypothetical protein
MTAGFLVLIVALIMAALVREAARGPTFRAEDHANYQDCLRAIPAEWLQGSMDRSGAEDACFYVHQRR